jgi:hypothetical protein
VLCLGLALGASGLALAGTAAGTTTSGGKTLKLQAPIEALALSGSNVAYDVSDHTSYRNGKRVGLPNRVLVWNLRTGKTTKVSGKQTTTADGSAWGSVAQLAIAGIRVAWLIRSGGNSEGDDELFSSSVLKPKERRVTTEARYGDPCGAGGGPPSCAGKWLGGLVGSGTRVLANRWTTDTAGSITGGGLYALNGASLKRVAIGTGIVEVVAADSKHVAVLHPDGTISVFLTTGTAPAGVTPAAKALKVAISGRNLVVVERGGKLALYDARSGSLRKTFKLQGSLSSSPALAVQGNVAVYSTGRSIHKGWIRALNLSSGKDRQVGSLNHQISVARLDSVGLVYANTDTPGGFAATIVFIPFKQVAAAVS